MNSKDFNFNIEELKDYDKIKEISYPSSTINQIEDKNILEGKKL